MKKDNLKIAVIGLGYVGLPLAVEFAKKYPVVGFDINALRIKRLNEGHDDTLEVDDENLKSVLVTSKNELSDTGILITNQLEAIADANFYIVTVPTPTDKNNRPVLTPLIKAAKYFNCKNNFVITYNQENQFSEQSIEINLIPAYKFLLDF